MNVCPREMGDGARGRRLLESLFSALSLSDEDAEAGLRALERRLSPSAADRICTFLGHPEQCPHERPIPPGDCCRPLTLDAEGLIQPVTPLPQVKVGELCEIVLVRSRHATRLTRLEAYGIVPGSRIRVQQKRPAFVVEAGHTELALDTEVARDILVRPVRGG